MLTSHIDKIEIKKMRKQVFDDEDEMLPQKSLGFFSRDVAKFSRDVAKFSQGQTLYESKSRDRSVKKCQKVQKGLSIEQSPLSFLTFRHI